MTKEEEEDDNCKDERRELIKLRAVSGRA